MPPCRKMLNRMSDPQSPHLYRYEADSDLCRLFEAVFGKPMGKGESLRHFNWEYRDNPEGKAIVFVARDREGKIISAYPTRPLRMKLMSETVKGSLSFDSMTHPSFKGKGLFTRLGREMYRYLEERGYVLTYGFPNGKIQHLRVTQLQWFEVCRFPLMLKILDFGPVVSRYLRSKKAAGFLGPVFNGAVRPFLSGGGRRGAAALALEEVSSFDREFTTFWQKARSSFRICIERDFDYLQWRYGRPEENYRILKLRNRGEMAGYAILKVDERFDIRTGYIMDVIAYPGRDNIRFLLAAISDLFRDEKASLVSALLVKGHPYYREFRKSGFLAVPRRFHPQEIHFGARINVRNEFQGMIRDPGNWFITWGDTDLL